MKAFLIAMLLLAASALPAKNFEGTATYKVVGGAKAEGHTMTMLFKDGLCRVETAQGKRQGIVIMDPKAETMLILMPEQKKYMEQALKGEKKAQKANGTLKKSGKTETIAGYKAEEWVYTDEDGKAASFWGAKGLGSGFMQMDQGEREGGMAIPAELRNGDFFPLRMTSAGKKGARGLEATKVEPGKLDAGLFKVPAGYTKMKGFGGMGAGGGMPPDAAAKMKKAMQGMSPEQRKMMEKMMQGQGAEE